MPNRQKESRVREIAEQLSGAQAAVLAGYRGLTVQEAAELRLALAEVNARFRVVKNSLTRLAVKEAGLEGLDEMIDGPTAIAYVQGDPVPAVKRLVEQGRRFPVLEVRGGFAEGRMLSAEDVRRFAELESREVMLAKMAGAAKGQIGRAAWMFQALQTRFLLLMEALKDKLPDDTEDSGSSPAEPSSPAPPARGAGSADASGSAESEAGGSSEGTPLVTGDEPEASRGDEGSQGEPEAARGDVGSQEETEQAEETTEEGGE
jgi:large subunit ribosomal protein L10